MSLKVRGSTVKDHVLSAKQLHVLNEMVRDVRLLRSGFSTWRLSYDNGASESKVPHQTADSLVCHNYIELTGTWQGRASFKLTARAHGVLSTAYREISFTEHIE